MRQIFALAVLVACVRLWLPLSTVPIGLSALEAHRHDTNRNMKAIDEPWLDAVEGIMNGPPGWDQDAGRALFRLGRR